MLGLRALLAIPLLLAALLPASALGQAVDPRGVDPSSPNPLLGLTFYNDPNSPSMESYRWLQRTGRDAAANLIWKIASHPKGLWLGNHTRPNFEIKVRRLIDPAREQGQVPLFTVLRAESNQCKPDYQAGGPAADARTRNWYDHLARVIGDDRVVIAFEPDSTGTIECLAPSRRDDRYRLLAYGVDVLSKLPNATIYLEGEAADWEPARIVARKLRRIGIDKVRGFMLNATHYEWTAANIRFGLEVSRLTGGKHFVINTAENGRGPVHYREWIDRASHIWRQRNIWCNPGLRGVGPPPTTDTSRPDKVDAYLWINRPGYAQSCQGRPIDWFLPRALTYTRYATDWESPPRGTKFGHFERHPLSAFGIPD
jgi:endoglucanase